MPNPMGINQYTSGGGGCLPLLLIPVILIAAVGLTTIGNITLNLFAAVVIIACLVFGIIVVVRRIADGDNMFVTFLLILLLIPFVIGMYNLIMTPAAFVTNSTRTPELTTQQLQRDFMNEISRNNKTVSTDGKIITLTRDNVSDISIIDFRDSTSRGTIGVSGQYDDRIHNISFNLYSLDSENNVISYNVNARATYTFNRLIWSSYGGWRTWVLRRVDNFTIDGESVVDTGTTQEATGVPETGASQESSGSQEAITVPVPADISSPLVLEGSIWEGSFTPRSSSSVSAFNRYVSQDRLRIEITEVKSDGTITATVTASSPDIRQTSKGTFDFNTFAIELIFDSWTIKPEHPEGMIRYEAYLSSMEINLMGSIDIESSTMVGRHPIMNFDAFELELKN